MSKRTDDPQVADNVFVFTGTDVNWVILQEDTELTLIDAGWIGDTQAVEHSIRTLGRQPQDVRAIILTHAHADHTGALNHLHDSYGIPIYMSTLEVPNALGEKVETGGPMDVAKHLYRPQVVHWAAQVAKAGGLQHFTVPAAEPFSQDGPLDLPGHPGTGRHPWAHVRPHQLSRPGFGRGDQRGCSGHRPSHPQWCGAPLAARVLLTRRGRCCRVVASITSARSGHVRSRSRTRLVRADDRVGRPGHRPPPPHTDPELRNIARPRCRSRPGQQISHQQPPL